MYAFRIAILLVLSAAAHAADLTPLVENKDIGARLSDVTFPESFPNNLRSGLTNRVLIRIVLTQDANRLDARSIELAVKYDLWDETYSVVLLRDGVAVNEQILKTQDEVLAHLRDVRVSKLFRPRTEGPFILRGEVLLNPIERERMDHIQQWVRENSRYVPLEGPAAPSGTAPESASNAMFNRIFEQYARGSDLAAQWRQSVVSAPFTLTAP